MKVCIILLTHTSNILNFGSFIPTQERIEKILKAGANVVLTTGGVDDLCLKYFIEAGAIAVRRCKKADLKVWFLSR